VLLVAFPLLLLSSVLEYQTTERLWASSLGRVAFIGFLIAASIFIYRLLYTKGGILERRLLTTSWPKAVLRTSAVALVSFPLALAILAAIGYYETSQTLAARLYQTACMFLALRVAHALLARWVLMRRRRLTMEQVRQRRQSEAQSAEGDTAASVVALSEASEEIDLGTVSEQTVHLLHTLVVIAAVVGGWLIWDDVVPALNLLENYPAWPGVTEVTLADILVAVVISAVAYAGTKNVPGFLELTLLNYLPVDAGARFATTTLCRYAIAASGIALAGRALGITWDSIQWLVAAMGIGLGFGLQEIFANFISGIILLFERPIRVGDTITIGDKTGVVTRIRMRATTVTDWDLKEYVVPNKDLVTGQLLNWTLSNQTNRIVIDVGVAYGSDTTLALSILLKIASDHRAILEDPAPVATFGRFGDSTLNLTLRCYLPDLGSRLSTITDLHSAIDDGFRNAGIEIAFPQQDIHIRTIQQPLKTIDGHSQDEPAIN